MSTDQTNFSNVANFSEQDAHADQPRTAFVFGCGYLGIRIARRLVSESWSVTALTRCQRKASRLAEEGIHPVLGDWTDRRCFESPALLKALTENATRVLIAVGYDSRSGHNRDEVYVGGLRNSLPFIRDASHVVYVSSTGVFHQSENQWVDEASPCRPDREGGKAHLQAEEMLFRHRSRSPAGRTTVLRMAGLYGPGRVPRVDSIRRGEPIAADPGGFLNLIHIDDAATTVLSAWQHPMPEKLYLISDGSPVLRSEYFAEIARIVGGPPVRYTGESGPRSDSSKRIWNRRMRRDLLARPEYPSYREGLRSILR